METATSKDGCVTLSFKIVNRVLKRFVTDDSIAKIDTSIHNFRQGSLVITYHAQQLRIRTFRSSFVSSKKVLEGVIVEGVHRLNYQTLRQWLSKHEHASLKDLVQKTESLNNFQEKTSRGGFKVVPLSIEDYEVTNKINRSLLLDKPSVVNVELSSPLRSLGRFSTPSSTNDSAFNTMEVWMSDLFAVGDYSDLGFDGTTSMPFTAVWRLCFSENGKTSIFQQVKNIATLLWTLNINFGYRQSRKVEATNSTAKTVTRASTVKMTRIIATAHRWKTEVLLPQRV